jgi:hypothetical protein
MVMKQVKNDVFQMTHQDSNPDESEDRGKELLRKQSHAVSGTKARRTNPWLARIGVV